MSIRFIEYYGDIYIVTGIGYDDRYDPPDIFKAIPLKEAVFKSLIMELHEVIIPIAEATEIVDRKKIVAIWVLFGR